MIVLIDTDLHRYQYGSIMVEHPFLEDQKVPASSRKVLGLVDESIEEIVKATNADSYICVLSGKGNFRNDIAKQQEYKGNRDPSIGRPYHYDNIGNHIIDNHPHIVVDGYEADDWMGITQRSDPSNYCIASRDKDLKTVHGWHYRFACGERQPAIPIHWMTEEESLRFFFHQMLIGDNTDNIPGCGKKEEVIRKGVPSLRRKGVGEKTAIKLLGEETDPNKLLEIISEQYEIVFGSDYKDVMLEQARLLYIGQRPDNLFDWSWICKEQGEVNELL
ncbi:5'-3' exonuclease [Trabzonvirus APT65]|uniref:5'-3' exonuclease n=1 Tax=Aeromonas phage APT65 TaxID=2982914 RepID=A0A9E8GAJ3_9CAUD|nr:5'-3' exonuclease [Aeromonas phage APT65]